MFQTHLVQQMLRPLVKVINDNFTIENALMSTIHSVTLVKILDNRSKKI